MTEFHHDLVAEPAAISAVTERAADFLVQAGVDGRCAHHVALMLDELLTNAGTHGGRNSDGGDGRDGAIPASVRIAVLADRVSAEVIDAGAPFDPRFGDEPDVAAAAAERPVGGVGLMLVRRIARDLNYQRRDDRNCTTFSVVRRDAGPKED